MFKLSFDIRFRNILSYIEGTLAGSGITLPADIFSGFLLLLILVQAFRRTDGHITVVQ